MFSRLMFCWTLKNWSLNFSQNQLTIINVAGWTLLWVGGRVFYGKRDPWKRGRNFLQRRRCFRSLVPRITNSTMQDQGLHWKSLVIFDDFLMWGSSPSWTVWKCQSESWFVSIGVRRIPVFRGLRDSRWTQATKFLFDLSLGRRALPLGYADFPFTTSPFLRQVVPWNMFSRDFAGGVNGLKIFLMFFGDTFWRCS